MTSPSLPGEGPDGGGPARPAATAAPDPAAYHRPGALMLRELPPLALYLHLPWCLKKCPYCDFNSHAVPAVAGDRPSQALDASLQLRTVAALLADLEHSLPLVWGRRVVSVFIGGGTPSLFSPEAIADLLDGVRARLPLLPGCEVTLEANPGSFERARFSAYRGAGVTRLSIGVQSFDDRHLKALGRVHDAAQARAAVEEAARAFDTFNIDLMYALPEQTLEQLQTDLAQALAFEPPHLSVYHLTLEPNTLFAARPPELPDEDTAWAMLDHIVQATAAAGLSRYEVSAFARAGHPCRHNLNYWQFGDYLGLGPGAHGKISFAHRIVRQVRWREPRLYLDRALAGQPVAQEREVPRADLPFEYLLGALRLREGFALADFTARTGLPINAIAAGLGEAERRGWVARDLHHVCPTPQGFDFLSDLQALFLPG